MAGRLQAYRPGCQASWARSILSGSGLSQVLDQPQKMDVRGRRPERPRLASRAPDGHPVAVVRGLHHPADLVDPSRPQAVRVKPGPLAFGQAEQDDAPDRVEPVLGLPVAVPERPEVLAGEQLRELGARRLLGQAEQDAVDPAQRQAERADVDVPQMMEQGRERRMEFLDELEPQPVAGDPVVELVLGVPGLVGPQAGIDDGHHVVIRKRHRVLDGELEEGHLDDVPPPAEADGGMIGAAAARADEPLALAAEVDELGRESLQAVDGDRRLGHPDDQAR